MSVLIQDFYILAAEITACNYWCDKPHINQSKYPYTHAGQIGEKTETAK